MAVINPAPHTLYSEPLKGVGEKLLHRIRASTQGSRKGIEDHFLAYNFFLHVRIKLRHFFYTLGFAGYNNTPYFSDNLPWSRVNKLVVEDLKEKGLYEQRNFMLELGYLSEAAKVLESSWMRFLAVSAVIPLMHITLWLAYFAIKIFCRKTVRDFEIAFFWGGLNCIFIFLKLFISQSWRLFKISISCLRGWTNSHHNSSF